MTEERRSYDQAQDATRRTRLANERTYLAWWRTGLTSLAVSLAAYSTQNVTLSLAAFAQLAFAEGDPSGRRCWPGRPRACGGEPA